MLSFKGIMTESSLRSHIKQPYIYVIINGNSNPNMWISRKIGLTSSRESTSRISASGSDETPFVDLLKSILGRLYNIRIPVPS